MSVMAGKRKSANAEQGGNQEDSSGQPPARWFPESQPSQTAAVRRKASMVEHPIGQGHKRQRKAAVAAAPPAAALRRSARNAGH